MCLVPQVLVLVELLHSVTSTFDKYRAVRYQQSLAKELQQHRKLPQVGSALLRSPNCEAELVIGCSFRMMRCSAMHVFVPARMLAVIAAPFLDCRVHVVLCVQAAGIHGLQQGLPPDKRTSDMGQPDMNGHGGSMQQAQQYDTSTQQIIVSQDQHLLQLHLHSVDSQQLALSQV